MTEPSRRSFPGSIYPATFDLVLTHAVEALRDKFTELTDEWERRDKAGEASTTFEELCAAASEAALARAVDVLNSLPYGVGIITPYAQFNRPSTFEPAVTIAINPLDGRERLRHIVVTHDENRGGVTANFAVRLGDEIVAAGAIDMYSALLTRVRMNDSRLVTSSDANGLECSDVLAMDAATRLSSGVTLLQGDPTDHGTLLRILGQEFHEQGVVGSCLGTTDSVAGNLLELAWGTATAFVQSGGDTVEAWDEWPMIGFAQAAGVRLFRTIEGRALQELALQPETSSTRALIRLYSQIFVAGQYVGELAEHVQVRQLT